MYSWQAMASGLLRFGGARLRPLAVVTVLLALAARSAAGGANSDSCGFEAVSAEAFARAPRDWGALTLPILVTGADSSTSGDHTGAWSAPFEHLRRLTRGDFDDTVVAVAPATSAALFDGGGACRMTLQGFRQAMRPCDAVFDTQNSAAGRHAALPIPGTAADAPEWWNILSIGAAGAGAGPTHTRTRHTHHLHHHHRRRRHRRHRCHHYTHSHQRHRRRHFCFLPLFQAS